MTERFRTTAWPGEPIPVPPIDVPDGVQRKGEWLEFEVTSYEGQWQELPQEFYLRQAREVDFEDLDAVADLVRSHGRFAPAFPLDRDLPHRAPKTWDAEFARFAASRGRDYNRTAARESSGVLRCHVDEVVLRLTMLRAMTEHALAYKRDDYERRAWKGVLRKPPTSDGDAWRLFVEFANAALREFHVRVSVDYGGLDYDQGVPRPTAYEASVLQLVNDLAQEDELLLRECPHCRRQFFRQVGRSISRSRLSDVKFCSPSCGRAASVKAYRARQRAERKG